MPNKRQRHIRAHAVKVGDEINYNMRWWLVSGKTGFNGDGDVDLRLKRGSQEHELSMSPTRVVKVMRPV